MMTRDDLIEAVRRNQSDTLVALRMREALGLPKPKPKSGNYRDRSAKRRKYRGARKLMKQRYGVDLR